MKFDQCDLPNEPNNESTRKKEAAVRIDAGIKVALNQIGDDEKRRAAFLSLLACVRSRTQLLKPRPGQGDAGWVAPLFLIHRLKNLASRQGLWLRPSETWRPEGGNPRSAFRSLALHLLALYPVPGFMDSVWDLPLGPDAFRQQGWYIRLGRGASFRTLNLPLLLTRKMEHYIRHAPDHYTVSQGLRYGEVRGLGGSEELAREIGTGRLGRKIEHAGFWRTVHWFFVTHPQLQLEYVNPIIDFVHANKFAGEEVLTANGTERREAPSPEFSMKGRTIQSMLRLLRGWNLELSETRSRGFSWNASGIPGYQFLERPNDSEVVHRNHEPTPNPSEEGNPCDSEERSLPSWEESGVGRIMARRSEDNRDWTIVELLDSGALRAEGLRMRHCVYTYANLCRRGETTIWSLRLRVNGEEKRMATIEVEPRKRSIIQARAKCNLRPGARSCEIIRQWAAWAGLQFESCL